ncbi:MAG: ABC transporter ATP-binding protein [Ruminococcus sp.]|nr:ABC transporter ATP-binding protein [Ruminococcus sp.]
MSMMEFKAVCKDYRKKTALSGVSFTVAKGSIYGLLGRNGAGKTTLVNMADNRDFPTSGQVLLDGENIKENDKALRRIYCSGVEELIPTYMSVKEVLASMRFFYKDCDADYATELCKRFGLDPKKKLSQLSTGYRMIAKDIFALASGAEFIFMDEPTLGLDPNHRELLYKVILERFSETEAAFVISTHQIDECAGLFERCLIIKEGQLIANEDSDKLRRSAYVAEGKTVDVEAYIAGKEVLSCESVGSFSTACVKGEPQNVPDSIEISQPSLQQLLIALTGGGE